LAATAKAAGAAAVQLGHTLDDQRETFLLRLSRGSSWRGLAGMAAEAPWPFWPAGRGLAVERPLLRLRRVALRAELQGLAWIEDPANTDPRFARTQVRARLTALEAAGLDVERLDRLQARFVAWAAAEDALAASRLGQIELDAHGRLGLDCGALAGLPSGAADRLLAALLAGASGGERLARADRTAAMRVAMAAGATAGTLGGAAWRVRRGRLTVRRDPGAVLGRRDGVRPFAPTPLPAGETVVWDGRFALTARAEGLSVRPSARPPDPTAPFFTRDDDAAPLAVVADQVDAAPLALERIAAVLWRGNPWRRTC
jgi:tRNA(Ile)-lysidine synthase